MELFKKTSYISGGNSPGLKNKNTDHEKISYILGNGTFYPKLKNILHFF